MGQRPSHNQEARDWAKRKKIYTWKLRPSKATPSSQKNPAGQTETKYSPLGRESGLHLQQ